MVGKPWQAGAAELRRLLGGLIAAGAALAIACGSSASPRAADSAFLDHPDCADVNRDVLPVDVVELTIDDLRLQVAAEIAVSDAERQQGLMCRSDVPPKTGMYFAGPEESTRSFWMYNTYVPLDVLYIDRDGFVVDAATLSPCPRNEGESDRDWSGRCVAAVAGMDPRSAYVNVLELPAGWLAGEGVRLEETLGEMQVAR